ncbi:MAG: ATP-binding protein [Pseudomonadota bacterium]
MGLFARGAAAIALLLLATQLFFVAIAKFQQNQNAERGFNFPLPERIAAMVELLESAEDPTALLTALNGPDISVSLKDASNSEKPEIDTRLRGVERQLAKFEDALGDRVFAAYIALPDDYKTAEMRRVDQSIWSQHPLRISVMLRTGQELTVETREDLVTQIYSVPIGFWSGVFGLIAGAIVLFVLRRETAPLRELARAATSFASLAKPKPVKPKGAAELRDLILSFNQMQNQISELLTSREVMLGALGHDLRTYLTRFQLKLQNQGVETLDQDIQRMDQMLSNCLALAKSGQNAELSECVDIGALLQRITKEAQETGDHIALSLPNEPLQPIISNERSLEQALQNLLQNAKQHGSDPKIEAFGETSEIVIRVMDRGPGIPEDQMKQVLQPFETLNKARTVSGNHHGLGLAIAHSIVKSIDGTLAFSANEPTGLIVTLRLPR